MSPKIRYKPTAEHRAKIGAANRGRVFSAEQRAKNAAAQRGRIASDETKAKMAAAAHRRHEEKPFSDETKAKISAAKTGELNSGWKGDDVGIGAAHYRHRKALTGQPCAHADETCKGSIQCAFKHDTPAEFVKVHPYGPYSPRPEDYMPLCASHHVRYDKKERSRA